MTSIPYVVLITVCIVLTLLQWMYVETKSSRAESLISFRLTDGAIEALACQDTHRPDHFRHIRY